jgi:hypothetical protein
MSRHNEECVRTVTTERYRLPDYLIVSVNDITDLGKRCGC